MAEPLSGRDAPLQPLLQVALADLAAAQGDWASAADSLAAVVARPGAPHRAHCSYGLALLEQGRLEVHCFDLIRTQCCCTP